MIALPLLSNSKRCLTHLLHAPFCSTCSQAVPVDTRVSKRLLLQRSMRIGLDTCALWLLYPRSPKRHRHNACFHSTRTMVESSVCSSLVLNCGHDQKVHCLLHYDSVLRFPNNLLCWYTVDLHSMLHAPSAILMHDAARYLKITSRLKL